MNPLQAAETLAKVLDLLLREAQIHTQLFLRIEAQLTALNSALTEPELLSNQEKPL
jgi:hypothetical protein